MVLFCGAGISTPAGLPSFRKLVSDLYEVVGAEVEPEEKIAIQAGQLDRALGLLEKRLNRGELRLQVNKILMLSSSADLTLHKAILTLARNADNNLRLVTTNFDNAFELAGCPEDEVDSAPKLPVPKRSTWHGLVHLHGRVHPQRPDLDDLVLTSADFGTAYLSEAWASRFVTEIFRHFSVLFVGYSVDDPVMRYLTDALSAERERGIPFRPAYAFAGTQGRRHVRKLMEAQWKSKSVEAIYYDSSRNHSKLKKTLEEWGNLHRLGLQSKHYIIRRHAQEAPTEGVIDDVARRVVWALSDPSGTVAAEFAKTDPPPPLRWLAVFEHQAFKEVNLLGSPAAGTPSMPLVSNGFNVSQPVHLAKVTAKLGDWLCRHLSNPELLDWSLNKGGWLHPTLRQSVREALKTSSIKDPLHGVWEILSSEAYAEASARKYSPRLHGLRELIQLPFSPVARSEIVAFLTPVPRLEAKSSLEREFLSTHDLYSGRIRDLVNVDLDLAGGLEARHFLEYVLSPAGNRADVLFALADDFTGLMAQAMHWLSLFGLADSRHDPCDFPIGTTNRGRRFDNWVYLIGLTWDSFLVASRRDKRLSAALLARWRTLDFPIFRRLILKASVEDHALDVSLGVEVLLENGAEALWGSSTRREALRFLNRADFLKRGSLKRLLAAIRKGPPRERPSGILDADWERYQDHDIWERIDEVQRSGANLDQRTLVWVGELKHKWGFRPRDGKEEESRDWITSSPEELSKYPSDQMDAFGDDELMGLLLQNQDRRTDLIQDWRSLVQRKPTRGIRLLRRMSEQDEWPPNIWEAALFGFRDSKAAHSRVRIGWLLRRAPASLFVITDSLSKWLRDESKRLNPKCEETYWILFDLLWRSALLRPADVDDPVNDAINHPVGILTQSLIQRLAEKAGGNDRLPIELRPYFNQIAEGEDNVYILARVMLASELPYLHSIDPDWTQAKLISRLDWSTSPEASLVWKGYLWRPRIDRNLFEALKRLSIMGLEHLDTLGPSGSNLIRLLAIASFDFPDSLSRQEKRLFLKKLDARQLEEVVDILKDFLEGAGEQSAALWRERVAPWFVASWPREVDKKGSGLSLSLALLVIKAQEAFPEAVAAVRSYLVRSSDISGVLFALEESEYPGRYPDATLTLLDSLLPYEHPQQLWGYKDYLSKLSGRIQEAMSKTMDDSRYRRIVELLEKTEVGP